MLKKPVQNRNTEVLTALRSKKIRKILPLITQIIIVNNL